VPADVVGEDPTEEQTDGRAGGRHGREECETAVAGRLVRGARRDEGEDARCGERGADALQGACGDEPGRGRGEPSQQARDREDRQADLEDAQSPEDVAEAPTQEQQPAEGEGVRVEHPGEARGREPEIGLDVRQRDVHDGRVEHEHELGDEDDAEADGAASGGSLPRGALGLSGDG